MIIIQRELSTLTCRSRSAKAGIRPNCRLRMSAYSPFAIPASRTTTGVMCRCCSNGEACDAIAEVFVGLCTARILDVPTTKALVLPSLHDARSRWRVY